MNSPLLKWSAVALALVGLCGCSSGPKKPKIAFVSNNANDFWSIAEAGWRKAAAEEPDFEFIFRKPDQGDAARQKEVLDALLSQDIKGVAVSVIKPADQTPYLNEVAGRASLLAVDNDAPASKRLAYVGTDNYKAGRAAGKLVKEAMREGGLVAIFVGDTGPVNARQRRTGVIDELADRPFRTDVADLDADADEGALVAGKYQLFRKTYTDQPEADQRTRQNAVDFLNEKSVQSHLASGKKVCMVGLWAYNPPACLGALRDIIKDEDEKKKPDAERRSKQVRIVGFDEALDTLQGITQDLVHGTIVQQPYKFGYESGKILAALARGDKSKVPAGGVQHVPYRIVTKEARDAIGKDEPKCEAAAAFAAELKELLGK